MQEQARRELILRTAERHPCLSEDIIAAQIAVVDAADEWFGGLTDLYAEAAMAVDNNLASIETAMRNGAGLGAPPADDDAADRRAYEGEGL